MMESGENDSSTLLIPSMEGNTSSANVDTSLLRILKSSKTQRKQDETKNMRLH